MSKEEEFDILHELEQVVNSAGKGITDEWKALQIRLLQESRPVSEQVFERDEEVKAVLCVGMQISEDSFNADADAHVERVGPSKDEYDGIHSGASYAQMAPAVGVKTTADIHKFLSDKPLVCSLYEMTNYVSLLVHAKYKQSELIAMTTPTGMAVSITKTGKQDQSFYLMFENETEDAVKECMNALNDKQRSMLMEMCEAQTIPPELKKKHRKMWDLMVEAIKENGSNPFLENTEGDE